MREDLDTDKESWSKLWMEEEEEKECVTRKKIMTDDKAEG